MGIILAIILAISAGVSYRAESSLPGDALYSVKTDVNERVSGWLALSAEAESEHQANLALRRLAEAEKLKAEGKLDAELKSRLEGEFKEHVKAADDEMDRLEEEGESDAASSVRTKIKSSVSAKGSILGITEIEIENEFESENEVDVEANSNNSDQSSVETNISSKVSGDFGELELEYESGALKLSGKLARVNPCVDWSVDTVISKDNPPSNVTFNLTKKSTAAVCIQVLGEPEKIEVETPTAADANITVKVGGGVVFSGKVKKFF